MKFTDLKSPGLKTGIEIDSFENILKERVEYLVIETPGNPGYYWGNYLIFPNAPNPEDQERWESLFFKEFAHQPKVKHQAFTWDSPERGATFIGFEQEEASELVLTKLQQPKNYNKRIQVRALGSDQDWEDAIYNQMSTRSESFAYEPYFVFKKTQMQRYRKMAEAKQGNWYGAFLEGKLVADCGFYCFHEIGRFQSVGTHPDFRRQGICATLIYECVRQNPQAQESVIVAELGTADRVYRSVGFEGNQSLFQLTKRPTTDD
jgi:hypothetical protein